jgi:hemin uptake protein HemP
MTGPSGTPSGAGPAPPGAPPRAGEAALVEAESLFRGRREVVIAHAGQRYRLRITQSGKLILTK